MLIAERTAHRGLDSISSASSVYPHNATLHRSRMTRATSPGFVIDTESLKLAVIATALRWWTGRQGRRWSGASASPTTSPPAPNGCCRADYPRQRRQLADMMPVGAVEISSPSKKPGASAGLRGSVVIHRVTLAIANADTAITANMHRDARRGLTLCGCTTVQVGSLGERRGHGRT